MCACRARRWLASTTIAPVSMALPGRRTPHVTSAPQVNHTPTCFFCVVFFFVWLIYSLKEERFCVWVSLHLFICEHSVGSVFATDMSDRVVCLSMAESTYVSDVSYKNNPEPHAASPSHKTSLHLRFGEKKTCILPLVFFFPSLSFFFFFFPSRGSRRPPGTDLGHPADAASHRGPHPGIHGRGRDQQCAVGLHAARLDRHLLQQLSGDPTRLNGEEGLFPPRFFQWTLSELFRVAVLYSAISLVFFLWFFLVIPFFFFVFFFAFFSSVCSSALFILLSR